MKNKILNTVDLETLQRATAQVQKLQSVAAELQPFLELVKEFDGKFFLPTDRLIRAEETAKILGVCKSAICAFANAGLLIPLYVNSEQKRCWFSQIKALPRKKARRI